MGVQVQPSVFISETVVLKCVAYRPDRWDNLPDAVKAQPGKYSNIMTFSAGPRVSEIDCSLFRSCLIPHPRRPVLG